MINHCNNRVKFFLIYWLFFLIIFHNYLLAQDSSSVIQVEPVQVIEKKSSQETDASRKDKTGFHSSILLDQAKERHDTLPQILEREAGLRVRQFGGLGSYSTLSIRGTNPNQSRFYIDGIPFNNSQTGEVNLADLPFDNLEEVEVYRSGVPLGFLGSAIGGIVNLKTMKPKEKRTRINIGGGSFNTGRGSVSHSDLTSSGEIGYTLFGIGEKSDQNFPFLNDQGTLFNPLDDAEEKRKNSQFERAQGTGNLFWNIGKTDLRLLADVNHRRHGVPGIGNNQPEKTQRKYTRGMTALTTNSKEFILDQLQLETRLYFSSFRDEFFDPRSEFSSGRPNSQANSDNKGFQFTPTLYLLEYFQILKFSLGIEWEDFRRDLRNSNHQVLQKEPIRNRRFRNLQIQDEIRLFQSRILVVPGVIWDEYRDIWENDTALRWEDRYVNKVTRFTNPRIGILGKLYEDSNHKFHIQANASRQARVPYFLELFGERGQVIGNQNLIPERSKNFDGGFSYEGSFIGIHLASVISIFHKTIQDMILFLPNSQFTLRPDNVDSARMDGMEFANTLSWKSWKWVLNYTYQRAINTSDSPALKGKFLPLRPMHELFTSLSYQWNRWLIGAEYIYIGAVFRDRTNEFINYLGPRDIYGAFLTFVLWEEIPSKAQENYSFDKEIGSIRNQSHSYKKELRLNFEVKNIGDKQFADFVGFPLPGRMWFLGVSYVF